MTRSYGARFVVQEHFARTHHFDLRLEHDGVFKSWVVGKSIPNAPGMRRLAIRVEDHDLGFGDFEGEIPSGQYGAAKVRIWDRGTFRTRRWDAGHITVQLRGRRLSGTYNLLPFRRVGENRWLLFKHPD